MPALFEVLDLKKYFPIVAGFLRRQVGVVKAVDNISFSIGEGKVLGMVGESGSGKSTAARAAIRLIEPTAAVLLFRGKDLMLCTSQEMKAMRKEIQIVFQDPYSSLNPRKTIIENMGEALLFHRLVETKEEQRDAVAQALKQVGLSPDIMHRYPHQFSGGQQQRICIGRAIALRPRLLICDEAVSALDVSIQAGILNLLQQLKSDLGLSYLFISHDLSVVRYIADETIVIYKGKIVESNATEELFSHPQHPYTQTLLAAIPRSRPLKR